MYQDVEGKIGNRGLKGTSGVTYGDARLFTTVELDRMLADGVTVYTPPPPPEPSPEEQERRRQKAIRSDSWAITGEVVYDEQEGTTVPQLSQAEAMLAIADLAKVLIPDPAQYPASIAKIVDDAQILRDAEAVTAESISTGRTVEEHDEAMMQMMETQHSNRSKKYRSKQGHKNGKKK